MNYYFVSKNELTPGDYLKPFQFGETYRLDLFYIDQILSPKGASAIWGAQMHDKFHQIGMFNSVILEYLLEKVRLESFPTKQSRLTAVFLWNDIELAHRFRQKYREGKNNAIYQCVLEEGTVEEFDMDLLDCGMNKDDDPEAQLERMTKRVERYWAADSEMGWPEMLAWGKVRVISKIE